MWESVGCEGKECGPLLHSGRKGLALSAKLNCHHFTLNVLFLEASSCLPDE